MNSTAAIPPVRRPGLLVAYCAVTLVLLPLFALGALTNLPHMMSGSFVDFTTLLVLTQVGLLATHLFLAWVIWQLPPEGGVRMWLSILTAYILMIWLLLGYACDFASGEGIGPFHGAAIVRRMLELTFLLPFHLPSLLFGYAISMPLLGIPLLLAGLIILAVLPALARQGVGSLAAWLTFLSIGYSTFLFGGTALGDSTWPDWLWPLLAGLGGGFVAGMIAQWRRGSDRLAVRGSAWAVCGMMVGAGCAALGGGLALAIGWPFVYQADIPGMLYVLAVPVIALLISMALIATFAFGPPTSKPQASVFTS